MSEIERAKTLFFEALDFINSSDFQNAERRLREVVELSPANPAALTNLSLALLQQGKHSEAHVYAARAVTAAPDSVEALLVLADCHARAGDFSDALAAYERIIALEPRIPEVHNNRGLALRNLARIPEALASYDRALELSPDLCDAHLNRGNALQALGRHDEALASYDRALAIDPDRAAAHLGRGNALHDLRRYEDALVAYDRALAQKPKLAEAYLGRGNLLCRLKRHDEAFAAYDRALALDPTLAGAHLGRGNALRERKRNREALNAYDAALSQMPDFAEAFLGRGDVLYDLKRYDEALTAFDRAIALKPDLSNAWLGRGDALRLLRRASEAIAAYRRALELGGDGELIRYNLAALGAEPSPAISPPRYIVGLFDMYADTFDQDLVGNLSYQSPKLLAEIIRRTVPPDARLDILDMGCGTGLMGESLRALKRTLTGVDLSTNMLNKARERAIYDQLIASDLVTFLEAHEQRFDLAVCTDVFIYVGDLAAVFAGVRRVLREDGLFGFSVEAADDGDFVLRPTLRYAHSIDYLKRLATQNNFVLTVAEPHAVRREGGAAIKGHNVVMRCRQR